MAYRERKTLRFAGEAAVMLYPAVFRVVCGDSGDIPLALRWKFEYKTMEGYFACRGLPAAPGG